MYLKCTYICCILISLGLSEADEEEPMSRPYIKSGTGKYTSYLKSSEQHFRVTKLNGLWNNAQYVESLNESRLELLYKELKILDKEEIEAEELFFQGKDETGEKLRKAWNTFGSILYRYGFLGKLDEETQKEFKAFYDPEEGANNKRLFKDTKLNMLWQEAEISAFNPKELESLRHEFENHQDKMDVYYSLLENIASVYKHKNDNANEIDALESKLKKYEKAINAVCEQNSSINDDFIRLKRLLSPGSNSQDSIEPKVETLTTDTNDNYAHLRYLKRPFRVPKMNLLWSNAQYLSSFTGPKLKSLYTELQILDKEETEWEELYLQQKDKDGVKLHKLCRRFINMVNKYFSKNYNTRRMQQYKLYYDSEERLFKDQKLNKLWDKAEISGFTAEELQSLKQEFQLHQNKVDVYYSLLENVGSVYRNKHENAINEDEWENFNMDANKNEIDTRQINLKKYEKTIHAVCDQNSSIKNDFIRLERLVSSHAQDFIEPELQDSWSVAQNERNNDEKEDLIEKQTLDVEKIQEGIEKNILKHIEL